MKVHPLLDAAGILGLLGAVFGVAFLILPLGIYEYSLPDAWMVVEAAFAGVGGFLALLGYRMIAPWLLLGALVTDLAVRTVIGPAVWDIGVLWPWDTFLFFTDRSEIKGTLFAVALAMFDLAFWAVLAAAILGIIALIVTGESPVVPSRTAAQGNHAGIVTYGTVPAGWYQDPDGKPADRFWDGAEWTEKSRPRIGAPGASVGGFPASGHWYSGPRNGMGTAALVLGILGVITLPIVFSVLAMVFGGIGVSRASKGEATNKGMALAGLILGTLGLPLGAIVWALVVYN